MMSVPASRTASVAHLVGPALRRALTAIYDDHARRFGETALTPQRNALLHLIARNPGAKQSAIAKELRIARSGVMILLNALEGLGLVSRLPHDRDSRSNGVHLTESGRLALETATEQLTIHDRALTEGISDADRKTFFAVLHLITANAVRSAPEQLETLS